MAESIEDFVNGKSVHEVATMCANLLDKLTGRFPYILLMADPDGATDESKRDTIIMSPLPRDAVEKILEEVGQRLPAEGRDARPSEINPNAAWPFPKSKQ